MVITAKKNLKALTVLLLFFIFNNCSRSADQSFQTSEQHTICTVGIGACEATGIKICAADGSCTECDATPGTPGIEGPEDDLTCADGIDNDCDSRTDNEDTDCEEKCIPEIEGPEGDLTCTDGIDNDCDGKTDNEDTGCEEKCMPPPVRQAIGMEDKNFYNLVEADCRVCHENPDQFPVLDDSIPNRHHLIYGTLIPDPTDSPFGIPGELYACLSCHATDTSSGEIEFLIERDCLFCHIQRFRDVTVHHRTDLAQGNVPQGPDCQACHGSIVDNMNDGHFISAEPPIESTPKRSGGMGLPYNSRGNGAGACDYCHDDGTCGNSISIETNAMNHHNTVLIYYPTKCSWCHDFTLPFEEQFRVCENCHGRDSLHNIQADSDGDGVINLGNELPFYGHIGDHDDCGGCHGYEFAWWLLNESRAVVPRISNVRTSVLTEGTGTTLTLTGSAFTNIEEGTELYSDVELEAADGLTITLTPDTITQDSLTVTIPGNLDSGNYKIKAVKMTKHSNPKTISIKPAVVISDITCKQKTGILKITGSGFGEKPEGTDGYFYVEVNDQIVEIKSWTDTEILVFSLHCKEQLTVTVNALFGAATWKQ